MRSRYEPGRSPRPAPTGVTVGEVYAEVSANAAMRERLSLIHDALFGPPGEAPDHFAYVKPSRARCDLSVVAEFIGERFGRGCRLPRDTPFGYLSAPAVDGWIVLFSVVADGTDRAIVREFEGRLAPTPWRGGGVDSGKQRYSGEESPSLFTRIFGGVGKKQEPVVVESVVVEPTATATATEVVNRAKGLYAPIGSASKQSRPRPPLKLLMSQGFVEKARNPPHPLPSEESEEAMEERLLRRLDERADEMERQAAEDRAIYEEMNRAEAALTPAERRVREDVRVAVEREVAERKRLADLPIESLEEWHQREAAKLTPEQRREIEEVNAAVQQIKQEQRSQVRGEVKAF